MTSEPAATPLRVCHIAATTEGAAWVFEQLRDLRDRFGYDVSVILNGSSGALVDRFKGAGIRVLVADFDFLGSGDLRALPKKILDLARILKRERFDVVQTHLFHSMVIGRIAAWLADVPVRLAMVAGPFHLEAYTPRWIDGSTQWMETGLVPSCEHSRTLYRSMGVASARLSVIYYGPDETKFEPSRELAADLRSEYSWAPGTPLIGMVAYFYPELGVNRWTPPAAHGRPVKSHAELIRAMPTVLREFPDAKLLLVGSGWEEGGRQYQAKMQALVGELGLADSVVFTGYRSDIPAVLKALDVAVQASVSENLGGSIEALLMRCPTVATRTGGLVDSVIDGETGVLVQPRDPADFARGIVSLLRDREAARALGERGRALMLEKFTLRKTAEDLHALYQAGYAAGPAGYRSPRQAFRLIGGGVVGLYLALRYTIFDRHLLLAWDAGWRPWHFLTLRRLVRRMLDGVLSPTRTAARRLRSSRAAVVVPTANGPANEQFVTLTIDPPAPIVTPLRIAARMMLYRFYAFVGRQKLGWGIRARIRNATRSTLGRVRAVVGRGKP